MQCRYSEKNDVIYQGECITASFYINIFTSKSSSSEYFVTFRIIRLFQVELLRKILAKLKLKRTQHKLSRKYGSLKKWEKNHGERNAPRQNIQKQLIKIHQ